MQSRAVVTGFALQVRTRSSFAGFPLQSLPCAAVNLFPLLLKRIIIISKSVVYLCENPVGTTMQAANSPPWRACPDKSGGGPKGQGGHYKLQILFAFGRDKVSLLFVNPWDASLNSKDSRGFQS